MTPKNLPPRIAIRLLSLFATNEEAESILGDLLEEFSQLTAKSGVAAAPPLVLATDDENHRASHRHWIQYRSVGDCRRDGWRILIEPPCLRLAGARDLCRS